MSFIKNILFLVAVYYSCVWHCMLPWVSDNIRNVPAPCTRAASRLMIASFKALYLIILAGKLDTIYKQETLFLLFLCYKTLSTFLLKWSYLVIQKNLLFLFEYCYCCVHLYFDFWFLFITYSNKWKCTETNALFLEKVYLEIKQNIYNSDYAFVIFKLFI